MFGPLVKWYRKEARNLPWRETKNPYRIWLSEVILQQTRVDLGLAYYKKFVTRFPTIFDLAGAPVDEILLLWQGLGYYSRARNLYTAANYIVEKYNGRFPSNVDELKKIKGIGEYTAAAIASFAFNIPVPVIDGNVYRVLSRFFEISEPIDTASGKKAISQLAGQILNLNEPDIHNQAIMELGAIICKPQKPVCHQCPLKNKCIAFQKQNFHKFPVKKQKVKQRNRYFYYIIIYNGTKTIIEKRLGNDIWQGLYQFPLIEVEEPLSEVELLKKISSVKILNKNDFQVLKISGTKKHVLSHQVLHARFIQIKAKRTVNMNNLPLQQIETGNINNFAFPRLITKYLEEEHG